MPDINLIKSNIKTMIDNGAPDDVISSYVADEGVTQDMLAGTSQPQSFAEKSGNILSSLGNLMEQKRQEWTTPTEQKGKVPDWAGKNPNLYGALGGLRESAIPVAEGMALGSNISPIGLVTGGLKYSAVDQLSSVLDKMLGNKQDTTIKDQASQALKKTGEGILLSGATLGAAGLAKGLTKGFSGLKSAIPAAFEPTTINTINNEIYSKTRKVFEEGIKPSFPKGTSLQTKEVYFEDASKAVQASIEHKNTVGLIDKFGDTIKKIETVSHAEQALNDTADQLLTRSNAAIKEATGKSLEIQMSHSPLVTELEKIGSSKVLNNVDPAAAKYARTLAKSFSKESYTIEELREARRIYNAQLTAFKTNPQMGVVNQAGIDAIASNNILKMMHDGIEKTGIASVREDRDLLKSIINVQGDVGKRAAVQSSKSPYGLMDFSNMYTAAHFMGGIVGGNVQSIASAGGVLGTKWIMKAYNDPDRMIKNLFGDVEKLMDKKQGITVSPNNDILSLLQQPPIGNKVPFSKKGQYFDEGLYKQPQNKTDWEQQISGMEASKKAKNYSGLEERSSSTLPAILSKKPVPTGEPAKSHPNWTTVDLGQAIRNYKQLPDTQKLLPPPNKMNLEEFMKVYKASSEKDKSEMLKGLSGKDREWIPVIKSGIYKKGTL